MKRIGTALLCAALCLGCQPKQTTRTPVTADGPKAASADTPPPSYSKSSFDAPGRVVAIGDVHGDFAAMLASLQLARVVDAEGRWSGGSTTLVQTGDLLDRGDDEQKIVDYLETLKVEAGDAGGRLVMLNGNHEVMNVAGDLRYVTPGGFADFEDVGGLDLSAAQFARFPEVARARVAAFAPGGPYAKILATKLIVAKVNDTVFVHGGVLPHHVEYGIDELNAQTAGWMRGERDVPLILSNDDAPIWTRSYSAGQADCATLEKTLTAMHAKRLVVGHTVQKEGITSDCDEKVWRIDVGMAAHYGGQPAALEITGDGAQPVALPIPLSN